MSKVEEDNLTNYKEVSEVAHANELILGYPVSMRIHSPTLFEHRKILNFPGVCEACSADAKPSGRVDRIAVVTFEGKEYPPITGRACCDACDFVEQILLTGEGKLHHIPATPALYLLPAGRHEADDVERVLALAFSKVNTPEETDEN